MNFDRIVDRPFIHAEDHFPSPSSGGFAASHSLVDFYVRAPDKNVDGWSSVNANASVGRKDSLWQSIRNLSRELRVKNPLRG